MRGLVAALVLLAGAPRAHAQDMFTLDPVMVSWVFADDGPLSDIAQELRVDLENTLGQQYLTVPLDSVADYADYSVEVYLDSCQEDQRVECGYVIGARGGAQWVIVGQLKAGRPGRPPEALFSVLDVSESREIVSFTSTVTLDNHAAIAGSIALVLEGVIRGEAELFETRDTGHDMWELRAAGEAQRRDTAAAVERDTGGLDALTRDITAREERPRMSQEDLAQYHGRDDATPWERLGLGEKEYVRYTNADVSIEDWRALQRGRLGTVRLRGFAGFGAGPYDHVYDGRYVMSVVPGDGVDTFDAFAVTAVEAFQALRSGGGSAFGLEVGVGVHPWVDVNLGVATRSVSYSALVYQESEGEPGTVPRAVSAGRSTAEWRVGATVSPLPSFSLRPTATAQLAFWRGIPVDHALGLPPALPSFDRPNSVMLHLAPGAEVALSKDVLLFARADMQLRVAGNRKDVLSTGDTVLIQTSDGPNAAGPLGFDLLVGVELPLGPLFAKGANGT